MKLSIFSRVILIFIICFSIYFFWHIEWNQLFSRAKQMDVFQTVYKEKDFSRYFILQAFNVTNDQHYPFPYKKNEDSPQTDDDVWKFKWDEWNQTAYGFEINKNYLCIFEGKKFVSCLQYESYNYACVDTLSGAIDICELSLNTKYLLPLCKEEASRKILTCGDKTHTNLCFLTQDQNKANFSVRPCTDQKQDLCLNEDGLIDTCLKLNENNDTAKDVNLNVFWSELNPLEDEVPKEKSGFKTAALCLNNQNKIYICESQMQKSEFPACVGAVSGKVEVCKEKEEISRLVPLCLNTLTKEVLTCGNFSIKNLCFTGFEKFRPLRPCNSINHRICLENYGLLRNCTEMSEKLVGQIEKKTTLTVDDMAEGRSVMEYQHTGLVQLCKNNTADKVFSCEKNSSLFAACFSIKDRNIKTCNEIESKSEISIPVCVQENTSNLVICEKFSHSHLCMHHDVENFQLIHCKTRLRYVCVTEKGSLEFCWSLGKSSRKINCSIENSNYILPVKYDDLELKLRSLTYICNLIGENYLVPCSNDEDFQVVCLNLINGEVNYCKSMSYGNLSIPVCIKGSENFVVTCGKFNVVPVCVSDKNESSKYTACVNTSNTACLIGGAIQSCNVDVFQDQAPKRHSISIRKVSFQKKNPDETPDFKHKKKVYNAERKILAYIMKNLERLCVKKGKPNEYSLCIEEKSLEFACLNISNGKSKNCKQNLEKELSVPLCVKKSLEVTTCGKFSKMALCLYKILDETLLAECEKDKGDRACLSKNGSLKVCSAGNDEEDDEEEHDDEHDDEHEEEYEKYKNQRTAIKTKIRKMINDSHVQNIKLCIGDEKKYNLVNCDEDPSLKFACLGAVVGLVGKCSYFKEDFPLAVCVQDDSPYLETCDIASKTKLCLLKDTPSAYTFPCNIPDQHACVTKNGFVGRCVERKLFSRNNNNKAREKESDNNGLLYNEAEFTVGTYDPNDETESNDEPDEYETPDMAINLSQDSNFDPTVGTQSDPSQKPVYPISRLKMSSNEKLTSEATNEKFIRIICRNCSIDHKFVIEGTPDDVLPEVELITFPKEG